MSRIALNAQHFSNDVQFFTFLILHFKSNPTANLWQPPRQVHERARGADVLGSTFSYDMSAIRVVPLGAYFKRGQIARPGSRLDFPLLQHVFCYFVVHVTVPECLYLEIRINGKR